MVLSCRVEMARGPDGCKQALVSLKDDAPWTVKLSAEGVELGCEVNPPQKFTDTGDAVAEICFRIPDSLLLKLRERTGQTARARHRRDLRH
jgi:hypothetical protein